MSVDSVRPKPGKVRIVTDGRPIHNVPKLTAFHGILSTRQDSGTKSYKSPLPSPVPLLPSFPQAHSHPSPAPLHQTAMLLWSTLLCLLSANFVVSQFAKPDILVDYDPDTTLQPKKGDMQNQDGKDSHVIRGLLRVRQDTCQTGYSQCTNVAGSVSLLISFSSLSTRVFVADFACWRVF